MAWAEKFLTACNVNEILELKHHFLLVKTIIPSQNMVLMLNAATGIWDQKRACGTSLNPRRCKWRGRNNIDKCTTMQHKWNLVKLRDAWECPNRHLWRISGIPRPRKTVMVHRKMPNEKERKRDKWYGRESPMNRKCQRPRHTRGDARECQSRQLLMISESPGLPKKGEKSHKECEIRPKRGWECKIP